MQDITHVGNILINYAVLNLVEIFINLNIAAKFH